jgi:hypothetical protein
MLQDATIGRHKQFVEDSSQDLEEAIAQARCILEGNGIRSS